MFKPTQPYRRRIEETFKDVPSVAIRLMETLLAVDPSQRGSALFALKSEVKTLLQWFCLFKSLSSSVQFVFYLFLLLSPEVISMAQTIRR